MIARIRRLGLATYALGVIACAAWFASFYAAAAIACVAINGEACR